MRRILVVVPILLILGVALGLPVVSGRATTNPPTTATNTVVFLPLVLGSAPVTWPDISVTPFINGLDRPVHITHAGDGSGRLFIVEKIGRVRIVKNGSLLATPFLDITGRVGSAGSEQGLLSVAFPPDYASKGYFYVNYTDKNGDTVIARYRVSADPDRADDNNEAVLLTIDQPYTNHNGGQIAFGPDGYLYIGMGDGGDGGDPQNRAQNPNELLGKMLRIDVETPTAEPYLVPPTNPFTQTIGYRAEIWALGLRNPWRFSFDRQTGDMYIGDVGQGSYEEIDFEAAGSSGGANYGWNVMEGAHCYNAANCNTNGLTLPVAEYRNPTDGCSVTGGVVYRGSQFASLRGIYLFGDYCRGKIWGLRVIGGSWQTQLLLDSNLIITTFGEDEAGEVYVADYANGTIYRLNG